MSLVKPIYKGPFFLATVIPNEIGISRPFKAQLANLSTALIFEYLSFSVNIQNLRVIWHHQTCAKRMKIVCAHD